MFYLLLMNYVLMIPVDDVFLLVSQVSKSYSKKMKLLKMDPYGPVEDPRLVFVVLSYKVHKTRKDYSYKYHIP